MALVSGLVLAGGEGRRLDAFKPALPLGGRPLIARPLGVLAQLAEEVWVAYGPEEHAERLEGLVEGACLVGDEGLGPLGGLDRGARSARGDWLLVAPCDAPFLSTPLYEALLRRARESDGCLPRNAGRDNFVIAAYRREALLGASGRMLEDGERAVRAILPRLRLARLTERDLQAMPYGLHSTFDIDTREDLARAEALLRRGPESAH